MNTKSYSYYSTALLLGVLLYFSSCKKFLDEKPDKSKTTVEKLSDLQELLDANANPEGGALIVFGTDEFYLPDKAWAARVKEQRDAYIWAASTDISNDWVKGYAFINIFNTVLKEVEQFKDNNPSEASFIKGQALMQRAFWFHQLAELYAPPYSDQNKTEPSIALRLVPDIEAPVSRSTVEQTYSQITTDLKEAAELLPEALGAKNRANKANAYGTLARAYLSMRDYVNAGLYADKYLKLHSALLDFNAVDSTKNPSMPFANPEVSFWLRIGNPTRPDQLIDTLLYKLYQNDDLRKPIFFIKNTNGTIGFKGGYGGEAGFVPFNGITSSEMYLIRSESFVRNGDIPSGLADLNTLLEKRWRKGKYKPYLNLSKDEALKVVLEERRKELFFRGTRWSDLRRLNLEGANITIKRVIEGITYSLPANDARWVWLIPSEIMAANKWQQNKR